MKKNQNNRFHESQQSVFQFVGKARTISDDNTNHLLLFLTRNSKNINGEKTVNQLTIRNAIMVL
jgi:hypothetical protein